MSICLWPIDLRKRSVRLCSGLKGISSRILPSEFLRLKKQFWGRHLWARGYLAVSSGNIADEMIQQYIQEQEGELIADDSRFEIDPS
jgi:putative transposase